MYPVVTGEEAPPGRRSPEGGVAARLRPHRSRLAYLAVGGTSFLIDLGLLTLLHGVFGVPLLAATAIAFVTALCCNFVLNRGVVFPGGVAPAHRQLAKYLALVVGNLLVTLLVVGGLSALSVPYEVAKVIAAALLFGANYVVYRRWVFC